MIIINPSILKSFFPWILWKDNSGKKNIYLTFDDGPHPVYTKEILDILGGQDIKASFFLNGEKAMLFPGLVERIYQSGHLLGNHGYLHQSLAFKPKSLFQDQIQKTHQTIFNITGYAPVWFRPPFGRFDLRFKMLLQSVNYRMVIWSLLSCDFKETNPEDLMTRVEKHLHPGAVIVFHDGLESAPVLIKALPKMIQDIQHSGYRMFTLERIPG